MEVGKGLEKLDVAAAETGGEGQSAGRSEEPEDHLCFASLAPIKAPSSDKLGPACHLGERYGGGSRDADNSQPSSGWLTCNSLVIESMLD